ncbi:DUF6541 family protein [Arthrobacter zhaoguopingii]|uniref:DUF6541 family protein n=1 Tax=Arthrobacter zhaoguopingii TaxID=2681491 RepID=UPI0013579C1B|nr:DUF6541 family protein [Arthrobacter zhaoguopingii]
MPSSLPELLQLAQPLLFLLIAFFLPGTLALLPLRVGWPAAVALGPAVTLLLLGVGTFVLDALGIGWTAVSVSLMLLLPVGAVWLAGRGIRLERPLLPRPNGAGTENPSPATATATVRIAVGAGLAAAAALISVAVLRGMGSLSTASQGWDAVFHGNAVRWIQESGRATPWSINPIYGDGPATFYPSGWHSVIALYPGNLVEAANASALVIGGLIWPIGLAFLASVVFPRHPAVWALTPVLAASFVSFPFGQLLRSGQWPNGLSTALTPVALAMILLLLRRLSPGLNPRPVRPLKDVLLVLILTGAVAGGSVVAHPTAVFALVAGGLPFLLAWGVPLCVRAFRHRWRAALLGTVGAAVLVGAALLVLKDSRLLAGVMNFPRGVRATPPDSLALAFFDLPRFPVVVAPTPENFNLLVGLLVILGAIAALVLRTGWPLVVSWLIFVGLYVLAAGPESPLRFLTGVWYKDTQRIAPLIALTASILAAFGLAVLVRAAAGLVTRVLRARIAAPDRFRSALAAGLAVVAVVAVYQGSGHFRSADRVAVAAHNYITAAEPGIWLLSSGEQDFIERAGALLPEDAVVIGDPFNGETYFYTLTGRHVVYSRLGSPAPTEAKTVLRIGFDRLHDDPAVCAAIEEVGATHFYQDQPASVDREVWKGFYGVETAKGFEPVLVEGGRGLYEITVCR